MEREGFIQTEHQMSAGSLYSGPVSMYFTADRQWKLPYVYKVVSLDKYSKHRGDHRRVHRYCVLEEVKRKPLSGIALFKFELSQTRSMCDDFLLALVDELMKLRPALTLYGGITLECGWLVALDQLKRTKGWMPLRQKLLTVSDEGLRVLYKATGIKAIDILRHDLKHGLSPVFVEIDRLAAYVPAIYTGRYASIPTDLHVWNVGDQLAEGMTVWEVLPMFVTDDGVIPANTKMVFLFEVGLGVASMAHD